MTKGKGRPRKNWLSFEEARRLVQDECISSFAEYKRWHDRNKPRQIPKRPERVYKEFIGWNDWLGNNNKFDATNKVCRPFLEAVGWVHKLHLPTSQSWFEYIREHGIPNDIPSHPELFYDQWISWPHWLGNTVSAKMAMRQEIIEEAGVLYLVNMPGRPANVIRIGVELGGVSAIQDAQRQRGFRVIKLLKMSVGYDWQGAIAPHVQPWWENNTEYVVSNIHELLFDLEGDLDPA